MLGGVAVIGVAALAGWVLTTGGKSSSASSGLSAHATSSPANTTRVTAAASTSLEAAKAAYAKLKCPSSGAPTIVDYGSPADYVATCGINGAKFLLAPSTISGREVSLATAVPATAGDGSYQIDVAFDDAGAKAFDALAARLAQQFSSASGTAQLAVVLNGLVISAPVVSAPITGADMTINGLLFSRQSAGEMASLMTNQPEALLFRAVLDTR